MTPQKIWVSYDYTPPLNPEPICLHTNSEVWYPIKDNDLDPLVKIDENLMKTFLEVNDNTPKESLYLELGIIPLIDIVKCRRVIYLHYLLTLPKDQLLYKFFQAQLRNPSKGDWCETVKKDLNVV